MHDALVMLGFMTPAEVLRQGLEPLLAELTARRRAALFKVGPGLGVLGGGGTAPRARGCSRTREHAVPARGARAVRGARLDPRHRHRVAPPGAASKH